MEDNLEIEFTLLLNDELKDFEEIRNYILGDYDYKEGCFFKVSSNYNDGNNDCSTGSVIIENKYFWFCHFEDS